MLVWITRKTVLTPLAVGMATLSPRIHTGPRESILLEFAKITKQKNGPGLPPGRVLFW